MFPALTHGCACSRTRRLLKSNLDLVHVVPSNLAPPSACLCHRPSRDAYFCISLCFYTDSMYKRSTHTWYFTSTEPRCFHFRNTAQVKGSGIAQGLWASSCHVLNTLERMALFTILLNPRLVIEEENLTGHTEFSE